MVTTVFHLMGSGLNLVLKNERIFSFLFFSRLTVLTLFFFCRLFTPIVLVPMVCVVGLGLFMRGFPLVTSFKTPSWH